MIMRKTVKARILATIMAMAFSAAVMSPVYAENGGHLVLLTITILLNLLFVILLLGMVHILAY